MVKQGKWSEVLEDSGEKENLLVLAADECEPLGYKLKPVSTRRLYFCRPPRTRSRRTPARQQAGLSQSTGTFRRSRSSSGLPDSEDLPSLIIPACRHLRKRQAWHAFLRRLVISHSLLTGQLYSMLPRRRKTWKVD